MPSPASTSADDINGRMLASMFDHAAMRLGAEPARALFTEGASSGHLTFAQLVDPMGWVGLDVFHAVADALTPRLGEGFLVDAVRWVLPSRRGLGAVDLTAPAPPEFFYRHLDRARGFYARHLTFSVEQLGPGSAQVTLRYREGVPRRRESCDVGRGILASLPTLFGFAAAEVDEHTCYARGAEACTYSVRWRSEPPHPAQTAKATGDHRQALDAAQRQYREIRSLNERLERQLVERTAQLSMAMNELREGHAVMGATIDELNQRHAAAVPNAGRSERSVREFIHEMRNPMSWVLSNLEYLEEATQGRDALSVEELSEVVSDAREGVDRMRGVLSWFLQLHQNEPAGLRPYDLDADVRATLTRCARDWKGAITAHLELGAVPPFPAHGSQLRQVLLNLLTNASRAMKTGQLWVSTRVDGAQQVVLTVRDDGPGIAAELLPTLFERRVGTRSGGGAGSGLHLCRVIAERHRGTLTAESQPGQGATFRLTVPLSAQAAP